MSRFPRALAGVVLGAVCLAQPPARGQVLFDNTKAETAGNADWVIDSTQPIPSPTITNITSSTSEAYWTGALSSWGVALAKLRNSGQISLGGDGLETLPGTGSITYGNAANAQDLSHYQVYVVCEPNIRFTDAEKTAILNFVKNGGGLFMVIDHTGSDRNNDGWDSLMIWNDLLTNNSVQLNPFGFTCNSADVSPSSVSADSSPSDPMVNGIAGTVTTLTYSSGTTMTINNTSTTHAAVWSGSSTTGVMALYGTYGAGRFAAIGDSSVVEDATSEPGHTTYAGWTVPADNGYCALNGTVWLLGVVNTNPLPPTVTTGAATAVTTSGATLNGTVNPNGQTTTAQFEFGLSTSYGTTAAVLGTTTGSTAQAVSAAISGLAVGTTYHFRLTATNAAGVTAGLDQSFTTATAAAPDLAITANHTGNFTQGDAGDVYTLTVTNVGSLATAGIISVVDALPAGLTAVALSGAGWTTDLGTLTCTRSDALAAGAGYPPLSLTVSVAANAAATVTNTASVSGGGDSNGANNTANDITGINATGGTGGATNVVISQFYGPGGNSSGVTYKNDFVELFNPLSTAVNLSAWSVQYAGASGTSWQVTGLNGSIQPYHYYLVQLGSGGANGAALPTPDATGTINISATSGKLALVNSQTALSGSSPVTASSVVDFVGYGTANAFEGTAAATGGGNTTSTLRKNGGFTDTYDNAADFTTLTPPNPRNSGSPSNLPLTPIQQWRQQWFGTTSNTGIGADGYVGTSDGMPNLVKYALGLNPLVATNSPVVADIATGFLRLTSPKNPSATDATLWVEVTTSLSPPAWATNGTTVLTNTASLLQVRDNTAVPGASSRFMRLQVTGP